jgi:hypothetical protein
MMKSLSPLTVLVLDLVQELALWWEEGLVQEWVLVLEHLLVQE